MAIILNLETATTNCSVSIAQNGRLLALKEDDSPGYSHSEQLHVFIEDSLREAKFERSDLDAIAVSRGPGSYTGLRIGVSAAKGLCFALDLPLLSVATLQSLAHRAETTTFDFIIPVLDARRMEVYSAVYDKNYNEIRETRAEIIEPDSFKEYSKKGKVLLIGSGAEKCMNILKDANFSFETEAVPSARQMCELSHRVYENGAFEDNAYFEPYYLKDFILQKK